MTGNWATSSEDESLERDVFPFKPDIITIMLGMNDASYRPFDRSVFDTYVKGYRYIIQQMQQHLPDAKIVLIEPSPWDDVTQTPSYPRNPANQPGGGGAGSVGGVRVGVGRDARGEAARGAGQRRSDRGGDRVKCG